MSDDGTGTVRGYAAVFGVPSDPLGFGHFVERVKPGAFTKTLQEADVVALWNHDENVVLGRTSAGTLRLAEDDRGLAYEIDLDLDSPWGRSVFRAIERRDVTQSSFGFDVVKDSWEYPDDDAEPINRTLVEVRLWDVSPVTWPAYPQTEVDVKRFMRALAGQLDRPLDELLAISPAEVRKLCARHPEPEPPADGTPTPRLAAAYRALWRLRYGEPR